MSYESVIRETITLICFALISMGIAMTFDLSIMQWIGIALIFVSIYLIPKKA